MPVIIGRRELIAALGTAAAWPLAARAQQAAMPVVGFLDYGLPAPQNLFRSAAFRRGLVEAGYVEGQNVTFELRWANTEQSLLPELAADLVRRRANVIVATGSPTAVLAAKAATSTVPIVFAMGVDPVKYGFVDSFNRPSGNVTGMNLLSSELMGKRISLLLELAPQSTTVGYVPPLQVLRFSRT